MIAAPLRLVHSVVMSVGHEMRGAVESVTVTLKQQRDALPASSVAVQQTCVVAMGKRLPEAGLQTIVGVESHSSEAVTV